MGPLIPLFWISGDVSSGVQSQGVQPYLRLVEVYVVTRSLRFISGATPTDHLVTSMAAKPSFPHTCEALVGLETASYHAATV